jgi:hypothetical protein
VLLEGSSLTVANTLIAKGIELEASKTSIEKIKMKMAEQIRTINANTKV